MSNSDLRDIEKFKKEKQKADLKGDLAKVAELCNIIGDLYTKTGQHEDAIEEHQRELQLCEALSQELDVGVAHRKIGECHMNLGQFSEALRHQRDYLRISESCDSVVEQQRAQATIGLTYLKQAEANAESNNVSATKAMLKKARDAFESSLQMSEQLHESGSISAREFAEMKARLLLNLGGVYDNRGDVERCTESMKQGIAIAERHGLHEELYMLQVSLAAIFERMGDLPHALRYYDMAIKSAHQTRNKEDEALCHMYKAKLLVQKGDFSGSKRMMKVARKANTTPATKQLIEQVFKDIIKMSIHSNKISELSQDNFVERLKLYEKLGDLAVRLSHNKQALKYYHLMLRSAEAVGKMGRELIPVYVSLSQTYLDDKQYVRALEYMRKELACRHGDREEECRTHLNIASAQERAGQPYEDVKMSYLAALDCAKKAKHRKLQVRALDLLIVCQENYGQLEHKQQSLSQMERLREKYSITDSDLEDSEGEASQESEEEEDIDLDDIVLSGGESDEEYDRAAVVAGRARRTKAAQFKRNEKGETPLHVAAISGDLKKVKLLLSQGHPVNERDYTGWLPIHEACNHGYVEIARLLLDHGANMNDRGGQDCGGITPLHDSCNCGNLEVIRLLVEKGANVHAKDDEGQTALDSLREFRQRSAAELSRQDIGEIKAIERLLASTMAGDNPHLAPRQRGASSELFNAELDDLPDMPEQAQQRRKRDELRSQRKRFRPEALLSSQDSGTRSETEEDTDGIIREYEESSEEVVQNNHRRSAAVLSDTEEDTDAIYRASLLDQVDPVTGAGDYQEVLKAMRHGTKKEKNQMFQPVRKQNEQGPALVTVSSYVGDHDDWLEDDLGICNKRKRPLNQAVFTTSTSRKQKRSSNEGAASSQRRSRRDGGEEDDAADIHQSKRRREASPTGDDLDRDTVGNENSDFSDIDIALLDDNSNSSDAFVPDAPVTVLSELPSNNNRPVGKKLSLKKQVTLTSMGLGRSSQPRSSQHKSKGHATVEAAPAVASAVPASTPAPPTLLMRLRVRIQDRIILVPVTSSSEPRTIGWLAKQSSDRYYNICHMRPVLSLTTQDGAMLAPDDLIAMILTNNEEVIGVVESWDLTPLPERYAEACKALGTVSYGNIRRMLQTVATSNSLTLNDLCLRPPHFLPITKALHGLSSLKELSLKGNKLGDEGILALCKVLPSLVNLRKLDVSSCQLTSVTLKHLIAVLEPKAGVTQPLQMLESLCLSFNPFGDGCTSLIASLVSSLPGLTSLQLQACHFSLKFFQQHRLALMEAMKAGCLESLDLSHNNLGSTGVELLLKCVKCTSLQHLNLTATVNSYAINHIPKYLLHYTQQSGVCLQELVLDCCCLTSEHIQDLARFVSQCGSLERLHLNGNGKLCCTDISAVLEAAARSSGSRLHRLAFSGCGLKGALQVAFIDAVSDKLNHEHPLSELTFTCQQMSLVDMESLREVWSGRWGDEAICTFNGPKVSLMLKM